MSQSYTALRKREAAGYPAANLDTLAALWKVLIGGVKRLGNALQALVPRNFHARMILLAEAYVAAQGYLLWPSSASTLPVKRESNDGFRYLDL